MEAIYRLKGIITTLYTLFEHYPSLIFYFIHSDLFSDITHPSSNWD